MESIESATSVAPETDSALPVARRPQAQPGAPHPAGGGLDDGARERPPVAHRGHRDRVPRQAVEEVDGAVDRVDHPVHPRADRAAAVLLPQHGVAGAQGGEPIAHEGLDRVVRRRDDIGRRALRGDPGPVPVLPRTRQIAQVRRGVDRDLARRSAAARGGRRGRRNPRADSSTAPGWPDSSLTTPSDHMGAVHDAREAEGSTTLIAPLQCLGTRTETASGDESGRAPAGRHKISTGSRGRHRRPGF